MKKLFGITIGGLQHKILNLVLIVTVLLAGLFALVSYFSANKLDKVVNKAREEQQQAITNISQSTMNSVMNTSMTGTTVLEAEIADDVFSEVSTDLKTLNTMATAIFENRDSLEPIPVPLPDPGKQGELSAQLLYEEGADYKNSKLIGIASYMTDIMKSLVLNSDKVNNCYIGLEDGTHMCIDANPESKFDENGNLLPYCAKEKPWYKGAAEAGGIYFTGIEYDTYTHKKTLTCSMPIYANGELMGVMGIDIYLDNISESIAPSQNTVGFVCIVNQEGHVIWAPTNNGVFYPEIDDKAEDLRQSDNRVLASFITEALSTRTNVALITINGKDYYMSGAPMETVGWAVVSVVRKETVDRPTDTMLKEYDKINELASEDYNEGLTHSKQTFLVMMGVILLFGFGAALFVANRIVKPIECMTDDIVKGGNEEGVFVMKSIYKTHDEIELLAESFADLSFKTKQYIEHITQITKEKERIGTELALARKIQADMLPNIYPAFPDRPEFDIYATMNPAKEVGGDFYDFFLIDNDHLGVVMADVSGKGVPAALFMMMSKILIQNFAMMGASPAEVLEKTNNTVCQNNEEEMFVTVWFGILEISTGKITAANAGHEFPILKKADGQFEVFKDQHGFVVGGMEGMKYKEYEMTLERGGALFLYTDGVPESTDADEELFGTERLIDTLNSHCGDSINVVELLTGVKDAVDDFVGDADQFDDLTMLGLTLT